MEGWWMQGRSLEDEEVLSPEIDNSHVEAIARQHGIIMIVAWAFMIPVSLAPHCKNCSSKKFHHRVLSGNAKVERIP